MKSAEELFNKWCCHSYSWDALSDIEQLRWHKLSELIKVEKLDAYRAGMTEAANLINERSGNYDAEHGNTDRETGCREYPKNGEEYMVELDDIQSLILSARDKKETLP